MLAKDQANSALSAARQIMDLQRSEESHQHQRTEREVVGLQSDQVSSSTSAELNTNTAEHRDWKDDDDEETQPVFLSDPTVGIVDGGSDSEGEAETAPIVDVLTSSDESEDWRNNGQSHHQLDQTTPSVSHTDSVLTAVRSSAGAGQYIPSPSQVGSVLVIRLAFFMRLISGCSLWVL